MKYRFTAAVAMVLLATLTACGSGAAPVGSTVSGSSKPALTPSPTKTAVALPDMTGKQASAASATLTNLGFQTVYVDISGAKWGMTRPNKDVTIVGTDPVGGTLPKGETIKLITSTSPAEQAAAEKAAADAAKLAVRYSFSCGAPYDYSTKSDVFRSYKDVWASKHYPGSNTCTITIDGTGIYDKPALIPSEQAIADVVAAHGGGGGGSASSDFGRVLQLCTKLEPDYADKVVARMDWKKAEAHGALALCPDAPHAAVLREVIDTVKYGDGNKVVGKDMEPGTYRTKPSIKDCYWSRNAGGGDIIDNDFVGFAPDGVTVTVYSGEGFESSRCGVWTKIG